MNAQWRFPHLSTAFQMELGPQIPFATVHPIASNTEPANPDAEAAACSRPRVLQAIVELLVRQDVSNLALVRPQPSDSPKLSQLDVLIHQQSSTALAMPAAEPTVVLASAKSMEQPSAAAMAGQAPAPAPEPRSAGPRKKQQQQQQQQQHPPAAQQLTPPAQPMNQAQQEAALAPEQDSGTMRATKRRKLSPCEQQLVPAPISAHELAGALSSKLMALLAKAKAQKPPEEGGEADDDDGDEGQPGSGEPYITSAQLKQLSEDVQHGKHHNALALVEQAAVQGVLEVLHDHIKLGLKPLIQREDNELSPSARHSMLGASCAAVALHVLTAPGMPKALLLEELVLDIINLLKYQLQYNCLVFWDARLWRAWRGAQGEEEAQANKGVAKRPPKVIQGLTGQLQQLCQLAAELMQLVKVDPNALSPLVRVLLTSLTVEGVHDLQAKAIVLLVAIFQHDSSQRQGLLDELLNSTISNLTSSKSPPRHYPVQADDKVIQMVCALIIQLVQGCARLPPAGRPAPEVMQSFGWAHTWADKILVSLLDKLPTARATKSDTAVDFKQFMENLLTDLLEVQNLPEWPAANTLLRRLANLLGTERGLKSGDGNVRLMCIDMLGLLLRRLCADGKAAEADEHWLQEFFGAPEAESPQGQPRDRQLEMTRAVVEHLGGSGGPLAASAREFLCSRYLGDRLAAHKQLYNKEAAEQEVAAYLKQARQISEWCDAHQRASSSGAAGAQGRQQAEQLVRALNLDGVLGRGKPALIRWLLEAGDRLRQDGNQAGARARAIKWLGQVIEADQSVLALQEVQVGVKNALLDDSVSVREAAVDLVGRHIGSSQELALAYFDVICKASKDPGITVRKRAVKILHECCVQVAGFPKASEAAMCILHRVADEETMRGLVTKICGELWFTPPEESALRLTPMLRAQQLAQVALEVYQAGGQAIHLPLSGDHALVLVMKEMLAQEGKPGCKASRQGAREVAQALLKLVLAAQDNAAPGGDAGMLPPLLALHAICAADVQLCMPRADPAWLVRCLQPLMTSEPGGREETAQRRAAERTICIVSVVDAFCQRAPALERALVSELAADLSSLISKHPFVVVVAAACRCICALARLDAGVAARVVCMARVLHGRAAHQLQELQAGQPGGSGAMLGRFSFTLGNLCRYGAPFLEQAAEAAAKAAAAPSLQQFLGFLAAAFAAPCVPPKTQDSLLQAMGMLCIARPELMLADARVYDTLDAVLRPEADEALKTRALANLVDLLKAEEELMQAAQQQAGEACKAAQQASTNPAQESRALAKQNGMGDGSSFSSGILQRLWDRILELAKDVGRSGAKGAAVAPAGTSPAGSTNVRRRALELVEVTLRGGLVAPWTAIPSLVALATDPGADISAKAVRVLKHSADRYAEFVSNQLAPGIQEAYRFQRRLWQAAHPGQALPGAPAKEATDGLSALYAAVVVDSRPLKTKMLQTLLKPFDEAACLVSERGADLQQLSFLAHCAAQLGYRRLDEPLIVLRSAADILGRRADSVLSYVQAALRRAHGAAGHADDDNEEGAGQASLPGQRLPPDVLLQLQVGVKAAQALAMLLVLKQFLEAAYALPAERVASFSMTGERRKQEEKAVAIRNARLGFALDVLDLRACEDASGQLLLQQFATFRQLLDADTTAYQDQLAAALADDAKDAEVAPEAANRSHLPATSTPANAGAGLRLYKADSRRGGRSTRGRGGGGRGRSGGGGGSGTAARRGASSRKRRAARRADSDDDEADDDQDDEDYETPGAARAAAKRRLEHVLH